MAAVALLVSATAFGGGRPGPTALDGASPRVIGARVDCAMPDECVVSWELARAPVRVFAGPSPDAIDHEVPVAVAPTGTQVVVPAPDPDPHYFEVVPAHARRGPVVGDRFAGLPSAPNTRDLGGYQTFDGKRTRWGRLYRSDGLAQAGDADRAALAARGLPAACPASGPARPLDDGALLAEAEAVTTPAARARDRALLRRLAADGGPHWVHCDLFADRLGWPAALVLTTLGVRRETVVADHLLSARFGLPPPPQRRPLDAAFEVIRRRYRTWDRYLRSGLGLDQRTYDRLLARYVTDR